MFIIIPTERSPHTNETQYVCFVGPSGGVSNYNNAGNSVWNSYDRGWSHSSCDGITTLTYTVHLSGDVASYGSTEYIPTAYSPYTGNTSVVCLVGPDGHGLDNVGDYVGDSYGIYSPGLFKTSTFYQNTIWTDGTVHGHDRFNNITDSYGVMRYSYVFPGKC